MNSVIMALALAVAGQESALPARQLIDREIGKKREAAGLQPAARSDDAEFVRRVFLDLIGTVPTVEEAERFFADPAPDKRSRLIDELLSSDRAARNGAQIWAAAILGVGDVRFQDDVAAKLPDAILASFARNSSLDEFARTVVTHQAPPPDPKRGRDGLTLFYTELFVRAGKDAPQFLAAKFTRVFMGYQIQCARCHDHPFDRWTQEEFYGMAAFFAGIKNEAHGPNDRAPGAVKGLKIPDSKTPPLPPTFLETKASPRKEETLRAAFARILTDPSNDQFARAGVNRVWALFFGRGFVHPTDTFTATNPPTHPELLDALTREFRVHRLDLRWLIREICNSETYQLSGKAASRNREHEQLYAAADVRPLRPEQLVDALFTATGLDPAAKALDREKMLREFRATLGYEFGSPGIRYQGGIPPALLMLNGPLVAQGTVSSPATRLGRILQGSTDERRRLDQIFLATICRYPREDERARFLGFVRSKGESGWADAMAALLNSAEFLLNH
jgi:hypothetical protein